MFIVHILVVIQDKSRPILAAANGVSQDDKKKIYKCSAQAATSNQFQVKNAVKTFNVC